MDCKQLVDQVDHETAMVWLTKRVDDRAMFRLIRRCLNAIVIGKGLFINRFKWMLQSAFLAIHAQPLEKVKRAFRGLTSARSLLFARLGFWFDDS